MRPQTVTPPTVVAVAIAPLASPAAGSSTRTVLDVDGGMTSP